MCVCLPLVATLIKYMTTRWTTQSHILTPLRQRGRENVYWNCAICVCLRGKCMVFFNILINTSKKEHKLKSFAKLINLIFSSCLCTKSVIFHSCWLILFNLLVSDNQLSAFIQFASRLSTKPGTTLTYHVNNVVTRHKFTCFIHLSIS